MKRFLAIFLAAVMILSTFVATTLHVAATTDTDGSATTVNTSAEELYLSDITPTSWKIIDGCTPDRKSVV